MPEKQVLLSSLAPGAGAPSEGQEGAQQQLAAAQQAAPVLGLDAHGQAAHLHKSCSKTARRLRRTTAPRGRRVWPGGCKTKLTRQPTGARSSAAPPAGPRRGAAGRGGARRPDCTRRPGAGAAGAGPEPRALPPSARPRAGGDGGDQGRVRRSSSSLSSSLSSSSPLETERARARLQLLRAHSARRSSPSEARRKRRPLGLRGVPGGGVCREPRGGGGVPASNNAAAAAVGRAGAGRRQRSAAPGPPRATRLLAAGVRLSSSAQRPLRQRGGRPAETRVPVRAPRPVVGSSVPQVRLRRAPPGQGGGRRRGLGRAGRGQPRRNAELGDAVGGSSGNSAPRPPAARLWSLSSPTCSPPPHPQVLHPRGCPRPARPSPRRRPHLPRGARRSRTCAPEPTTGRGARTGTRVRRPPSRCRTAPRAHCLRLCRLLETHTRRKESLFLGGPGAADLLTAPRPRARTYGGGGGVVGGRNAPLPPPGVIPGRLREARGKPRPPGTPRRPRPSLPARLRGAAAPRAVGPEELQPGRARSVSSGDEDDNEDDNEDDERRTRPLSPPSGPHWSLRRPRPRPERCGGRHVALGPAGGACVLAAEYSRAGGRLRLRLLPAEGPAGGAAELRAPVGCRVSFTRRPAARVVRRSAAPFGAGLCLDGLTEDEVRRLPCASRPRTGPCWPRRAAAGPLCPSEGAPAPGASGH
ncbi:C2 calcium-dependent domain-containing protein 4A [Camelus dromedarius]|uniref:C2 calcium-dependent domain-containing protein 4A n=1 Tax=Camelus dromedarius TaxID=9838 RepID=A0A5N4E3T0_CAMDR|nr:C2 calcium-dependent domain-containing protein 4A [Camelus dromedarius]